MHSKCRSKVQTLENNQKHLNRNNSNSQPLSLKAGNQPKKTGPLDTLAQLYENTETKAKFKKRSSAKYLTDMLVIKLLNVLDTSLEKPYWNTWHCSRVLEQDGKILTGRYCGNRWCQVCNRIRTAKLVKGYLPQIELFKESWFITLTRPNVDAELLHSEIEDLLKQFNRLRRHFHDSKDSVVGLRKLECTHNYKLNTYHPHFHLIIEGNKQKAELIKDYWLKINLTADIAGQDIRPVTSFKNGALELFKYFTKLTTKTENGKYILNAESLNVIFESMKRKRVFQPMGIKKMSEDIEELQTIKISDLTAIKQRWVYDDRIGDFISEKGVLLTGNKPTKELCEIVGVDYEEYCHNRDIILNNFMPTDSFNNDLKSIYTGKIVE